LQTRTNLPGFAEQSPKAQTLHPQAGIKPRDEVKDGIKYHQPLAWTPPEMLKHHEKLLFIAEGSF
jgi:hypothetical protein